MNIYGFFKSVLQKKTQVHRQQHGAVKHAAVAGYLSRGKTSYQSACDI